MSQSDGYKGDANLFSAASQFNSISFLVNQILNGKNVAGLVQIKAVTNTGGLSPVGFVDVQPMVNQLDGNGNAIPHGTIHNLIYFRLQGGANAVIIDPQVGDIGFAVFADRDISAVKATKAIGNPGSSRRADMADGAYFGGFLNGTPTQYIQFSAGGISVTSPTKITLTAPVVEIDASTNVAINTPVVAASATITAATDVVGGGKSLKTHVHSGVSTGGSNTGGPV